MSNLLFYFLYSLGVILPAGLGLWIGYRMGIKKTIQNQGETPLGRKKIYIDTLRWALEATEQALPTAHQTESPSFRAYRAKREQFARELNTLGRDVTELEKNWNSISGEPDPDEDPRDTALRILQDIEETLQHHLHLIDKYHLACLEMDPQSNPTTIHITSSRCLLTAKRTLMRY